jgi:hypothetical protein
LEEELVMDQVRVVKPNKNTIKMEMSTDIQGVKENSFDHFILTRVSLSI